MTLNPEISFIAEKEIVDQDRKAGLLQWSLKDQTKNGTVMLTPIRLELKLMPGGQWRHVTSTIVYDKECVIVIYKGNTL